MVVEDVLGNTIEEGDCVFYARKDSFSASGELVFCKVQKIHEKSITLVRISKPWQGTIYHSKRPSEQIIKQ